MYQYHIKISGEKEPIVLDQERGARFKKAYDDNTIPKNDRVNFGEQGSYIWGDVRGVKRVPVIEKDDGKMINSIAEHNNMRRDFLKYPIEVKASHLALFRMYFQGMMSRVPTEEETEKARTLQLAFYQENPKRMRPDLRIFDSLVPKQDSKVSQLGMSLVNIAITAVNQDLRDFKYS